MKMPRINLLLTGVFTVHCVWVAAHLFLVAGERVNPWKLGGYGMYTQPAPQLAVEVYTIADDDGFTAEWEPVRFRGEQILLESGSIGFSGNLERVFRCWPVPEYAVKAFLSMNKHIIGKPVLIRYVENKFDDGKIERGLQGRVLVRWTGSPIEPLITSEFC